MPQSSSFTPNRPATDSTPIDMVAPIAKNALSVLRSVGPLAFGYTSAIGGPPTDVSVPMKPEAKPAPTKATGVGRWSLNYGAGTITGGVRTHRLGTLRRHVPPTGQHR